MSHTAPPRLFRLINAHSSSPLRSLQASTLRRLPLRPRLLSTHPFPRPPKAANPTKILTAVATAAAGTYILTHLLSSPLRNDAPLSASLSASPNDLIPTGTSTIPFFPRHLTLPPSPSSVSKPPSAALPAGLGAAAATEEYVLLGLGVRTVSLLRFQVYVVGIYICKSDLHKLQACMIRAVAGEGASTLVENEKGELRRLLLEAEGSERLWGEVLKGDGGVKGVLRIVPTRDTNMGHMRDGFVRMVGAGARREGCESEEGFRGGLEAFKGVMGGGGVKKGRVLLLGRGERGELGAWVEGGEGEMRWIGGVGHERVGRYLWMGYLAGGDVATEGARSSVVDGVVELVERPVGTVETQVV